MLDRNYKNVLNYTEQQMLTLCNSNDIKIAERSNYSFIRQNGNSIYTDFTYSQCIQANYIAFQNPDYSNKWFFAWIDEVIYKGDNNCELKYTIDDWSTWFPKINLKPCFIAREHVLDDTIGSNTIDEGLDVGKIIEIDETYDLSYSDYYFYGVLTSYNPATNTRFTDPINVYNKNIFSKKLVLFEGSLSKVKDLGLFLIHTNKQSHIDDIESMFYVPKASISDLDLVRNIGFFGESGESYTYEFYTLNTDPQDAGNVQRVYNIKEFNTEINKVDSFSGVTIKNNKCFCYPYNYLYVTNNVGNENIYRYEDFSTAKCLFKNQITLSEGMSGRIFPLNYKGQSENLDETIPLGKYPQIQFSSNSYVNWLTEQAVDRPTQLLEIFNSIKGHELFNPQTAFSFAGKIINYFGQDYKAKLLPNVTKGQNTADINFLSNNNKFVYKRMRATNEYIQQIDDIFTRFGYKINRVKTPTITGRQYWNYCEIGSGEITAYGEVPSKALVNINNAFTQGVTVWHDHSNVGNFALNNTIV